MLLPACYPALPGTLLEVVRMVERKRLGLREIRALEPNSDVWDTAVAGFGARRRGGERVSYCLIYRTAGGLQRRYTIGKHGSPWTPETAREEARRLLGRVAAGADPAAEKKDKRTAATVGELCDEYLGEAETGKLLTARLRAPKKASTVATDRGRIEGHIRPLLGSKPVASVTRADVEAFMHAVADGKTVRKQRTGRLRGVSHVRGGMGTASRTVGLLGAIFTYAMRKEYRLDNPCHGVLRPADGRRDRRLTDTEYLALGEALQALELDMWPSAVAMCRFLALTGWRGGEAQALRWSDVDLARRTAILPDTKTGRSMRPLSHQACAAITAPRIEGQLVFPPARGDGLMTGWQRFWRRIQGQAQLPKDITPHVLRHSFASIAADLGYSEPTIAALIGHRGHGVTARYIHAADAVLLAAADKVADRIAELMGEAKPSGQVVPLLAMSSP